MGLVVGVALNWQKTKDVATEGTPWIHASRMNRIWRVFWIAHIHFANTKQEGIHFG
jgi:hypothetical protein